MLAGFYCFPNLVSSDVSELATKWELENRIENQDARRGWFKKELELLNLIKSEWANKRESDQLVILSKHPFDDSI
ncbi:Imm63 family immunity protein [Kiloniella antarctica]|uniref:Imm63 family immunity protein n=1 Tax=Kiloniella antarctica TaxID=1550907 RepID=A0ABW5BIM7_9PROT